MTRPCLCGLAGRPRRLFGFTAREAAGGAPSFRTVLSDLGGSGLPPTFTPTTLLAGVSKIQGGFAPLPKPRPLVLLKGELVARADREDLDRRLTECPLVLLRRASEHRERPVVDRDRVLGPEHLLRRVRRVARVHDEVAADGDHDQVGLVVLPDQLHVAEESRVAHMVELEPVLELDDEATRLAAGIGRALLRDGI